MLLMLISTDLVYTYSMNLIRHCLDITKLFFIAADIFKAQAGIILPFTELSFFHLNYVVE